jgi:hypothetical protein
MADTMSESKSVHVSAYERTRYGHLEHVREHWRSPPRQYLFDFMKEGSLPLSPVPA